MKQKNLKQRIEKIKREELAKGRFDGVMDVQEFDDEPCFKASIDAHELKRIKLSYNPKYEEENPGNTELVVKDLTRHEINHKNYSGFKGCPRTVENHAELIIEPMMDVLGEKGYTRDDTHYVANALEDTILHDDLNQAFALDGIASFLEDVGVHTPSKKFTDFYEAHVKLNLYLWGSKKQKKELAKYFTHKKEVKEVLQNFLKRTGLSDLKQEASDRSVKDKQKIRDHLNNEKNWPEISRIYAEELSKLMKPGYAMPLFNHSGKGTKGQEKKTSSNNDDDSNPPEEGNQFDKEMYNPQFKKARVQKAYEEDQEAPNWINNYEAMDIIYQNLAKKLNIKVETYTEQTSMPIYWYGKRPFNPEKDNLKHTTFELNDKGRIELKKKRWSEDTPLEYKVNPKGFPEVRFCLLDTSGSMQSDPHGGSNIGRTSIIPWGDNSKYHYASLGWYGLLEYLKQNHLLKQTNISLANFGTETTLKHGLAEAKKLALNPQFSNSTNIDVDTINSLFKNQDLLIFTISDGEIQNWENIKDEFIKKAKKHHYFHLQIGGKNKMTRDLKKSNLHVEYIKNAQDLATKVIDLTDQLYRG